MEADRIIYSFFLGYMAFNLKYGHWPGEYGKALLVQPGGTSSMPAAVVERVD